MAGDWWFGSLLVVAFLKKHFGIYFVCVIKSAFKFKHYPKAYLTDQMVRCCCCCRYRRR